MWCEKCSAGNEDAVFKDRCSQCGATIIAGNTKWLTKSPFPKKPTRSIRAMWKRVNYVPPKKDETPLSEDVAATIKDAQHRQ